MTSSTVLPLPISKEVRALSLPWFASLACMVVPVAADAPRFLEGLSIPAYFLGTAALGALSIGHEYTDRTLGVLLSLPVRRERLLAAKLGVLAVMLLTLWAVAHTLVFGDSRMPQAEKDVASVVPVLCGLFLAPWLTMACRNPIAGTVFTVAIPGILLVAGELIGVAQYGYGSVMEAFRRAFVWFGTLGLCAVGAAASYWTFLRLEAIDGGGVEARLPQWLRSRTSASTTSAELTTRHPVWLLVKKELCLQQLPLVLAALYVLGWCTAAALTPFISDVVYWYALTSYAGLLSLVVGSSASAGERQIGTLEWQVLQPMAASKQWAVKVGVVWVVAMVLALGVPTLLVYFGRLMRSGGPAWSLRPELVTSTFVTMLTSGSLYVSSLSRSGLWALVMSLPATLGAWIFLNLSMSWIGIGWFKAARIPAMLTLLLIGGFVAILLRFASANHRSSDRPAERVWRQVLFMAAYIGAAVIAMAAAVQSLER